METTITSRTETEATFTVTVSESELKHIKSEVFDRLRKQVKAAGFRPGKAPDAIVERELGSDMVQAEVLERAVQHTYSQAIREQELPVVASPNVSIEKFVPYDTLEYKATVELMPKVTLPEYQKFRIKRPGITIEPAEIERTIEDLRRREAVRLESEQPAAQGDEVNFDFKGTKDGELVPGASATKQTLQLGSKSFIPGFEEELLGMKAGDDKTFDIRFPKDYHEKTLANEEVTFAVKLNTVTQLVLPVVDAEFVSKVSPFKTVDELRDDVLQEVTGRKAESVAREYEQLVLGKLLAESKYQTPEALVQQQLARMRTELEQNLGYSGLDLDKYLELSKKTAEALEAEMRPEAERRVGLAMVLTEVASAEKLAVSSEELDAEVGRLKGQYPDEQTQTELENDSTREEIYNHLMASRVIARLLSFAEAK